ncbi:PQQ-like beta-propeller repeat protein [Opitutales bacterium]|nr:PQQ-like beta-propeller repeat protein [Opitutales bacterium]
MKKTQLSILLLTLSTFALSTFAADWPQWRGPNRDGVSTETGILDEWPEGGPKLLWKATGVGAGFSSVSVANGRIYTMGDGKESSNVHCLNPKDGKIIWSSKPVGKTGGNYKGTRCTPTFDDGHLYALGQFGDLVCLRASDGSEVWRKSLTKDFGGRSGGWNYTESPLVDEGKVIVTPGGKQGAVVALEKKTGELVWQSKEFTDGAQYSSLIVREFGGKRQYVQLTGANVVGLEASTGKVLWQAPRKGKTATISTPIFHEGHVFVSSAYGVGCNGFKVTHSGGELLGQGNLCQQDDLKPPRWLYPSGRLRLRFKQRNPRLRGAQDRRGNVAAAQRGQGSDTDYRRQNHFAG